MIFLAQNIMKKHYPFSNGIVSVKGAGCKLFLNSITR